MKKEEVFAEVVKMLGKIDVLKMANKLPRRKRTGYL